jgi:hypothetical protein
VVQLDAAAALGVTSAVSGNAVAVVTADGQQLCAWAGALYGGWQASTDACVLNRVMCRI